MPGGGEGSTHCPFHLIRLKHNTFPNMTVSVCIYECMPDTVSAKTEKYLYAYVLSLCNTHLAQQEELVSALLSVLITRALHLLQVNSIQLKLLVDKNRTLIRCFFCCWFFFRTRAYFSVVCVCDRDIMRWVHRDYARTIQDEQKRYGKQFWKKSHELERIIKMFRSCVLPRILPFITGCFSHINSLQAPWWEFSECAKAANEKHDAFFWEY